MGYMSYKGWVTWLETKLGTLYIRSKLINKDNLWF